MDLRQALNHLLASPLFARYEAALRQESIFDVLAVGEREVSHAAFLRWLLSPQEGHGAGEKPLRRFLMRAVSLLGDDDRGLSALAIDGLDLEDASAVCEHQVEAMVNGKSQGGRLDILVEIPVEGQEHDPLLVIEHKVYAGESGNQTQVYAEWARRHPFRHPSLEGEHQPLLVFVCPDVETLESKPASPFVVLEYGDLSAWLDDVLAAGVNDRARFLINEYKACLTRRDLFGNPQAEAAEQQLLADEDCAKAVGVLRVGERELRGYDRHVAKHGKAFTNLGVQHQRVASKGDAATIMRLRELVIPVFEETTWQVHGGTGALTVFCQPYQDAFFRHLGKAQVEALGYTYLMFGMARPEGGKADLTLGIGIVQGTPDGKRLLKVKTQECASRLREAISKAGPNVKLGRSGVIARLRLEFPGIGNTADDTANQVAKHEAALQKAVEFMKTLQPVVDVWIAEQLPKLLTDWRPSP